MLSTWIHCFSLWARKKKKNWCTIPVWRPHKKSKLRLGREPSGRTKSTYVHFKNTARGKQKPRGACSCTYDVTGNTCHHGSWLTSHDNIDPLQLPQLRTSRTDTTIKRSCPQRFVRLIRTALQILPKKNCDLYCFLNKKSGRGYQHARRLSYEFITCSCNTFH